MDIGFYSKAATAATKATSFVAFMKATKPVNTPPDKIGGFTFLPDRRWFPF